MDNLYVQASIKHQPKLSANLSAQFKMGMSMVALAVVQQDLMSKPRAANGGDDREDRETWAVGDQVKLFTSALAPFLLPMVASLAKLPEDQPEGSSESAGEDAA